MFIVVKNIKSYSKNIKLYKNIKLIKVCNVFYSVIKQYKLKKISEGCTYDELPEIKGEGFYEEEGLFDFFHIGEQANLQCEDGYKATGATTTTCTENGFVNEGNMICVKCQFIKLFTTNFYNSRKVLIG